jgi:hypothetical protein
MVNQQIPLSSKPNVHIWLLEPLESSSKNIQYDYSGQSWDLITNAFIDHIKNFCEITIRTVGTDTVDRGAINIAPIISIDLSQLQHNLSNIDENLYKFCNNNNIVLLQAMTRETIDYAHSQNIINTVNNHIINRGFSSKTIKVLYVAYEIIPELVPIKDYLICADYFNVILGDFTTRMISLPTFEKNNKRSYIFSLLAGRLIDRYHRVLFLANAYEQNLMQTNFFCTSFIEDKEKFDRNVEEQFKHSSDHSFVKKHCRESFKHYTVDANGNELIQKNIYDNWIEYAIPKQVLDSYVHIVLETQVDTPSLTEKIYKPLMAGLIFIWHGPVNTLQYLESLGFKRYKHIDYSFDSHPDTNTRMHLLLKEIHRLKKKDLRVLVKLNKDIIEHNQKKFWEISSDMNCIWKRLK